MLAATDAMFTGQLLGTVSANWHLIISMCQLRSMLGNKCLRKRGWQKSVPLTLWDPKSYLWLFHKLQIFQTLMLWVSEHDNTRKTIPSQRLRQWNLVVILTSFIRLKTQVTKLRVVKMTHQCRLIVYQSVLCSRSNSSSFDSFVKSVSKLASLSEGWKRYGCILWVFPCCVFCRIFLGRNRRTTCIPGFHAN